MAKITDEELLSQVKTAIKELSNFNDDEITLWIKTAKQTLLNSKVPADVVNSDEVIGLITILVNNFRLRLNIEEDGTFKFLLTQFLLRRS